MTPDDEPLSVEVDMGADTPDDYPDTLSCSDGQVHFGVEAQTFLAHWVSKLGLEVSGAALIVGDGCSIAIIHPETGKAMTLQDIAKAAKPTSIRAVQ
jgi:hypothetical protein